MLPQDVDMSLQTMCLPMMHVCYLPAMRHRVLLNFEAQAEGIEVDRVLLDILEKVTERADDLT